MKKFIVLYTAPVSAEEQMQGGNPDEMKVVMAAWGAWYEKNKSSIIDFGTPLGSGSKITKDGVSANKLGVTGYSILQSESKEAVEEILKSHPHLNMPGGCDIEVYECLPVPGME